MSEINTKLVADMKAALKAKQSAKLNVIRMVIARVKQKAIDTRQEVSDDMVVSILQKMVKERTDALKLYEQAGRDDLVKQELFEKELLQQYLPQALSADDLQALITTALNETGAESMRDMGKVVAFIKEHATGRVDMSQVSALLKAHWN